MGGVPRDKERVKLARPKRYLRTLAIGLTAGVVLWFAGCGSSSSPGRPGSATTTNDNISAPSEAEGDGCEPVASSSGIRSLKIYNMVGLPQETDADIKEFADFILSLAKRERAMRLSVAVQAFVPKPATPFKDENMVEIKTLKGRIDYLRKRMGGRVKLLSTSPRWSWIDWKIAHSGEKAAQIAVFAEENGSTYSAWKKATQLFCP